MSKYDMEMLKDKTKSLPKGWEMKKLKEIGIIQTGNTPSTKEPDNYGDFIPFVKPAHFKIDGTIEHEDSGLSEKGLKSARLFEANSILMVCIGATIGKTGFSRIPVTSNQQINALTPYSEFEPKFLYYQFITSEFQKKIILSSSQATLPIINKSKWENLTVFFPKPLPDQKRIVSILDRAFAAIAKAKANAEQNLNNAKELFESYLQGVFENGHGWNKTTLGNVCSLITDGKHGNCKDEADSGFYFLSAKDVRNDTLLFENGRQITESDFYETHRRTDLKPGDICLINTGATIGRMAFAPDDSRTYKSTFQKSVAVIKTIPESINNKFCAYLLKADLKSLVKISAGTAVPNLLLGDMKRHKISVPKTLEEQNEIVSKLDTLVIETKKLETIYQKKIENLEDLKKSILQKAFNGGMTTVRELAIEL